MLYHHCHCLSTFHFVLNCFVRFVYGSLVVIFWKRAAFVAFHLHCCYTWWSLIPSLVSLFLSCLVTGMIAIISVPDHCLFIHLNCIWMQWILWLFMRLFQEVKFELRREINTPTLIRWLVVILHTLFTFYERFVGSKRIPLSVLHAHDLTRPTALSYIFCSYWLPSIFCCCSFFMEPVRLMVLNFILTRWLHYNVTCNITR